MVYRHYFVHYVLAYSGVDHYSDVIMDTMTSQITGVPIVCSTDATCADQRKHQSSVSLAFVRGIHRWPVNSQHTRPATRKMFSFDDVIMLQYVFRTLTFPSHFLYCPITYSCWYVTPFSLYTDLVYWPLQAWQTINASFNLEPLMLQMICQPVVESRSITST